MSDNKKRRRLLFLGALAANRIGGIEGFAVELARQLNAQSWDMILCHESEATGVVRDFLLSPGNVTLDVMQPQEGIGFVNVRDFAALVRKHRPAVLLYTLGGPVRWWPMAAQFLGVKRSIYYDQSSRVQNLLQYTAPLHVKLVMKPLDLSICATAFVKSCSDREQIVPPEKSRVVYSAIDNHRDLGSAADFRKLFSIPEDRLIVLQVSWLVPEKGIDVALRAAKRVLAERQDLQFVFCGDGKNRSGYEAMARELGIAEHVTWCGQLANLAASGCWPAAAIQMQCSQWQEAFCLAVAEGMSASLPVVASRIGGLPELVEDERNGILFDPQDDAGLAEAILRLAGDDALRRRMGQESRKIALHMLDLPRNVAQWTTILLNGLS